MAFFKLRHLISSFVVLIYTSHIELQIFLIFYVGRLLDGFHYASAEGFYYWIDGQCYKNIDANSDVSGIGILIAAGVQLCLFLIYVFGQWSIVIYLFFTHDQQFPLAILKLSRLLEDKLRGRFRTKQLRNKVECWRKKITSSTSCSRPDFYQWGYYTASICLKISDSTNFTSNAILAAIIVNAKTLSLYHIKLGWELAWVASLDLNGSTFALDHDPTIESTSRYIFMILLNACLRVVAAYKIVPRWSKYDENESNQCYRALPQNHLYDDSDAADEFIKYAWINFALTLIQLPWVVNARYRTIGRWILTKVKSKRRSPKTPVSSWIAKQWSVRKPLLTKLIELFFTIINLAINILMLYWIGLTVAEIVSMLNLNAPLVGDDEFKWGFGQVIAICLLIVPLYEILMRSIEFYRKYPYSYKTDFDNEEEDEIQPLNLKSHTVLGLALVHTLLNEMNPRAQLLDLSNRRICVPILRSARRDDDWMEKDLESG